MQLIAARAADIDQLARWNRELQEEEGTAVMPLEAIGARLERLLASGYSAHLFVVDAPVGYALCRALDPEVEGSGLYIQQFHIDREQRRRGHGRQAFEALRATQPAGQRILLEAVATNPAGHAFWQALGFTPYSTRYELSSRR